MNKYQRSNLPRIPRAPVLKFHNGVEYNYEKMKEGYKNKIPFLSEKDILRIRQPYFYLLKQLQFEGYDEVVEEILLLKSQGSSLPIETNLLCRITDVLKFCYVTKIQKKYIDAAKARLHLAEELLETKDFHKDRQRKLQIRHFLLTALATSQFAQKDELCLEFQAKLHCLLAFTGMNDLDENTESSIKHLERARFLSEGKKWLFQSKLIQVEIEKPISICGLRPHDKQTIRCNGLTIYNVATLLCCDLLMMMIKETLTRDNFEIVSHLSTEVLKMAHEIRHTIMMVAVLTQYGIFLRQNGAYNEALSIFQQLSNESELAQDFESLAITYGNIGRCLQGRMEPVESLNWLYDENQLAKEKKLKELEAESIEMIGFILLEEGHLVESEQCILEAYHKFEEASQLNNETGTLNETNFVDTSWAMSAVTSGMAMWGRFAGLCRQETEDQESVEQLLDWKDERKFMHKVPKTTLNTHTVYDYFEHLDENKIPIQENCDLNCLKQIYKGFFKTFQRKIDMHFLDWDITDRSVLEDGSTKSKGKRKQQLTRHLHQDPTRREITAKDYDSNQSSQSRSNSFKHDHHHHHPKRAHTLSDGSSGSPKLNVQSNYNFESISYASDKTTHLSHSSSEGHKKLLSSHSSLNLKSIPLHLGRQNMYRSISGATNTTIEFHNRMSVAMIQSLKNIINPLLVPPKHDFELETGKLTRAQSGTRHDSKHHHHHRTEILPAINH